MKLSKNVLVGSLATTGMILGMVAPATTAFAATSTGAVDKTTGAVTQQDATEVGSLNDGALAIAYDKGDGSTVADATAKSNANVTVVSGILTLDAVPDFGFGNGAAGSTVTLKNNDRDANADASAEDGNNEGLLQVTESRVDKDNVAPGFTLTAALAPFTSKQDASGTGVNDFTLNLASQGLVDGKGENVTTSTSTSGAINSEAAALTSDSKAGNVMSLKAGTYKTGSISTNFTKADGDKAAGATLDIPDDAGKVSTPDKASAKSFNSTITWTLTPTAAVVA